MNAAGRAGIAVILDIVFHLGNLAYTRGVDDHILLAVPFESHIHRIARGAGDFTDNDALRASHRIDKGALAGVAFADDGNPHQGARRFFLGQMVQFLADPVH